MNLDLGHSMNEPTISECLYVGLYDGVGPETVGPAWRGVGVVQVLTSAQITLTSYHTGRVPKFGRLWLFSNIFSIIYEHICLKIGLKTGEPLIY